MDAAQDTPPVRVTRDVPFSGKVKLSRENEPRKVRFSLRHRCSNSVVKNAKQRGSRGEFDRNELGRGRFMGLLL
jgi:hypothetical protein